MKSDIVKNIIDASNKIANMSIYGNGDYIVCNQYISNAIFELNKVEARKAKIKKLLENVKRDKS